MADLSDIVRELSFAQGGGYEESALDKLNRTFGTIRHTGLDLATLSGEAVKRAIDEYVAAEDFSSGKDYGIYSYDLLKKIFTDKDIKLIDEKRINNNIQFKAIYTGTDKVIEGDKNQELVKIDQDRFPILCDIGIFNDEVSIHTLGKKPYGILIKNKELATTLKSIIEYVFAQKR